MFCVPCFSGASCCSFYAVAGWGGGFLVFLSGVFILLLYYFYFGPLFRSLINVCYLLVILDFVRGGFVGSAD